jgi:hypothetical protein
MVAVLGVAGVATALTIGSSTAYAHSVVDTNPGGDQLFLISDTGSANLLGHVGSQSGADVINSVGNVGLLGLGMVRPAGKRTPSAIV